MDIKKAIAHAKEQKEIFGGTHKEFLNIAIEALEKQIPKKVNNYEKACDIYGDCPNCGRWYSFEKGNPFNYCPGCGQAMDWSEEE